MSIIIQSSNNQSESDLPMFSWDSIGGCVMPGYLDFYPKQKELILYAGADPDSNRTDHSIKLGVHVRFKVPATTTRSSLYGLVMDQQFQQLLEEVRAGYGQRLKQCRKMEDYLDTALERVEFWTPVVMRRRFRLNDLLQAGSIATYCQWMKEDAEDVDARLFSSGCEAEMANITLHFYLRMPYDLYCRDTLRVKQRTLQILMDYAHSLFGENPPRPIAEGSFMNQLSLLEDELADLVANFNPKRCEGYF